MDYIYIEFIFIIDAIIIKYNVGRILQIQSFPDDETFAVRLRLYLFGGAILDGFSNTINCHT